MVITYETLSLMIEFGLLLITLIGVIVAIIVAIYRKK